MASLLGAMLMFRMLGAGLSRLLDASTDGTSIPVGNMLGTVAYTAPEVFKDSFVTKPSDVYAFGILSTPPHQSSTLSVPMVLAMPLH